MTSDQTKSALKEIQPEITNWAGSFVSTIRITLLILTGVTLLHCAAHKEWRDGLDLTALLFLSLLTPPLVAFGIYFGCWHAARHTARLTSLLPSSKQLTDDGRYGRAYLAAIYPGLPALVGACVLALVLVLKWNQDFSNTYFWNLLVIVWALTVPHMMATARFDRKFLVKIKK